MSSLAPPAASPPAAGWGAREVAFSALNLAVVAMLVPPASLAPFFSVCITFVALCRASSTALLPFVRAAGILVALILLLYYKSSALVFNDSLKSAAQALFGAVPAWYSTGFLVPLGASYCFLRFVYALLERGLTPSGFARYYFFAPTFFYGPIMPPQAVLAQRPVFRRADLLEGAGRILFGLLKLGLSSLLQLAVPLSHPAHNYLALNTYSAPALWVGLYLSGIWLYLNFSAFTDLAIGAGRLFGIRIPENFNNPFGAADLTDFWRRWHITLSDWLRACIFNPLAKLLSSRVPGESLFLACGPVLLTMLICGLWHQTTLAYVAWGAQHGAGLAAHQLWIRLLRKRNLGWLREVRGYRFASWALTHTWVALGWALFFPLPEPGFVPGLGLHLLYLKRLFLLG